MTMTSQPRLMAVRSAWHLLETVQTRLGDAELWLTIGGASADLLAAIRGLHRDARTAQHLVGLLDQAIQDLDVLLLDDEAVP